MSFLRVIWIKLTAAIFAAILFSICVSGVFALMAAAAWFAFDQPPPFPWPLLKFILFIAWVFAAFLGAIASPDDLKSEPTQ